MEGDLEGEEKNDLIAEQEYQRVLKLEISWRQKSKIAWLKEGDRNTKYFHKMVAWRWATNSINRLKVEGEWVYN